MHTFNFTIFVLVSAISLLVNFFLYNFSTRRLNCARLVWYSARLVQFLCQNQQNTRFNEHSKWSLIKFWNYFYNKQIFCILKLKKSFNFVERWFLAGVSVCLQWWESVFVLNVLWFYDSFKSLFALKNLDFTTF